MTRRRCYVSLTIAITAAALVVFVFSGQRRTLVPSSVERSEQAVVGPSDASHAKEDHDRSIPPTLPHSAITKTTTSAATALLMNPWLWPHGKRVGQEGGAAFAMCSRAGPTAMGQLTWPPVCPEFTHTEPSSRQAEDVPANADQDPRWVSKKYKFYASRCAKTDGMMWSKLSRKTHDIIADRVANITGLYARAAQNRRPLRLLDWASGCGVSLSYFSREILLRSPAVRLEALGVDITPSAVEFARNYSAAPGVVHCAADGTALGNWIPRASFDAITSFGGLLHVPADRMCPTIQMLADLLRGGSVLWAGYIDRPSTVEQMVACRPSCRSADGACRAVDVVVAPENKWLKGVGVPSANRRRRPASLFWIKPEECEE